ncbi:hypothetical protein MN116_001773 [Schistosoma mekongi]|uniref:U6 snRNA-associated Sm-like protein LSm4 n=1 Tax=Schistosoma mekongi TaxID=38744 RepID=A0AAE2D7R7_SCHME|nr:hypothetical protein MN116_001773 [Schistosoma mekongi]
MLPVTLLKAATNLPMLVELKSGETYNGHLVACDDWMNIHLKEVICTSRDGDRFWKMPECYIRGSIIKLRKTYSLLKCVIVLSLQTLDVGASIEIRLKVGVVVFKIIEVVGELGVVGMQLMVLDVVADFVVNKKTNLYVCTASYFVHTGGPTRFLLQCQYN